MKTPYDMTPSQLEKIVMPADQRIKHAIDVLLPLFMTLNDGKPLEGEDALDALDLALLLLEGNVAVTMAAPEPSLDPWVDGTVEADTHEALARARVQRAQDDGLALPPDHYTMDAVERQMYGLD